MEYEASRDGHLDNTTPSSAFANGVNPPGIGKEYTILYRLEQNSVTEIMNLTLLEIVNSMRYENQAESEVWAEALQLAVDFRNLAPTRAHSSSKTPSEFWNGRHPYIGHLRGLALYLMSIYLRCFKISLNPANTLACLLVIGEQRFIVSICQIPVASFGLEMCTLMKPLHDYWKIL